MTISSEDRSTTPFAGNGVATSFPFAFKVFAASDLVVVLTDADGVDNVLVLNSDYSVTLNPDQDNNPGGSITYPIIGSPLAVGESLIAYGDITYLQPADIVNQSGFYPRVIENALDRVTMLIQQVLGLARRAIRVPVSAANVNTELPDIAQRAGRVVAFDADGNVIVSDKTLLELESQASIRQGSRTTQVFDNLLAGQTSINTIYNFVSGANQIAVSLNGALLTPPRNGVITDYEETGPNSITFTQPLQEGDVVVVELYGQTTNFVDSDNVGYQGGTLTEVLDDVVGLGDYTAATTAGLLYFCRDLGGVPGADNSAAFAAAIALGKPFFIEPGSYNLTTFDLSPAAGARIIGAGMSHTELVFVAPNTTARNAFVLSNSNVTFEHIKVRVTGPVGATVQTFALRASNLTFSHVEVDGENTALNANVINAFNFADANVDNLRVLFCDIHNVQRVNLRTNTNTGIATNLLYLGNRFRAMGQGGLQFNFPLGSISGVRVIGNFFKDFHAGTEKIYTGGASLTNALFANNLFQGSANECIHLEEGGDNIAITGNTFAANAHGVFLGDNNVGGSFAEPSRITVTGNSFLDGSLTRTNEAVRAPNNGVGVASYSGLVIADNVIRGYDRGLNISAGAQSVHGNTIVNCNIGARSEKLGPWLAGNTFQNCNTAISGINGAGVVGKNRFVDPLIYAVSEDGSRISMAGMTLDITTNVSLPGSTATLIPTALPIAAGNRMWGSMRASMGSSSTRYRHRGSEITWDGTTLTDTEKVAVGSGDIAFTGFVVDSATLKARLNNTGALQTMTHFSMEFDGIWTSAT